MHTIASNGKMLQKKKEKSTLLIQQASAFKFDVRIQPLPFHKVDHVYDARRADHGLVCQDGSHGLFHAELWPQWREKWLDLFPEPHKTKH